MNAAEKTRSPFARVALGMAWCSLILMLAPFIAGMVFRVMPQTHSNGRAMAVVWGAFIANAFVVAPVSAIVVVAGIIHVLHNRSSISGMGHLAAATFIIVVSTGGGFLVMRAIFGASL